MKELSVLIEAYIREKQEKKGTAYCPASWLDSASKRASQIYVATHIPKYSHSDAKGTNVWVREQNVKNSTYCYVSTDGLSEVIEDIAGNGAVMDVASLLRLEVNGVSLLDLIAKDDSSALAIFADNQERLKTWMHGFKSVLADKPSSDTLVKQVYFPTGDGNYHLLAPLYPSSLAQAFYERVKEARFGEIAKKARECKKKDEFSEAIVVDYPSLAVQCFGGTKPQNISLLNNRRGGKSYLLKSAPPHWKNIKKPPMKKYSFWRNYGACVHQDLKEFKNYLYAVKDRNNKEIRIGVQNYIDRLLDLLLNAAADVQCFQSGWSKLSEISIEEQLWLDPLREDFQEKQFIIDWKSKVADSFATFITRRIDGKHLMFGFDDTDHQYLKKQCLTLLKEVESCSRY